MATRATFTRLAHYSREFSKANVIFLPKWVWQVWQIWLWQIWLIFKLGCFMYKTYFLCKHSSSIFSPNLSGLPNSQNSPKFSKITKNQIGAGLESYNFKNKQYFSKCEYSHELKKSSKYLHQLNSRASGHMLIYNQELLV